VLKERTNEQQTVNLISQIHAKNYYHEFDLVQEGGHLSEMGIQFELVGNLCAHTKARYRVSRVLSKLIARIEMFDESTTSSL